MFCMKCGAKIADGSKFCPYCGFDGREEQSNPPQSPPPAPKAPAPKPVKKEKDPPITIIPAEPRNEPDDSKWWIWLIIFLVSATILAGIFLLGTRYIDYSDLGSLEVSADTGGVKTNEGLLTVTITLPASFFSEEDMSAFDADAYAKEQEFLSAKVNEDGSVTVKMTKARHQEILDEMAGSIDEMIAEFVEGEDTPYIRKLTHNDDFSRFEMEVDRAEYENALDLTPLSLGVSAMIYQMFLETESYSEIVIIDADTGDIINTVTYPVE